MVKTPSDEINPAWLSLLSGDRHARLRNALITGAATLTAYRQVRSWVNDFRDKNSYTLTVHDTDDIYPLLHAWIIDQLPPADQRSLRAVTRRAVDRSSDSSDWVKPSKRPTKRISFMYDGTRVQRIRVGGHTIHVHVEDSEMPSHTDGGVTRRLGKAGYLHFRCYSESARDALVALLAEVLDEHNRSLKSTNDVWIATKWGAWETIGSSVPRPLETVVLADGQREALVTDVQEFRRQEMAYLRYGIPWHRGYLLHGPPGTGKTSVAQAVAGHFDLDVYYVPLSDMEADTDLVQLLSRVDERSMLLLEDIDVAHATRERDDQGKGISLSGLLNALDGVITPHGQLTVMTTNNIDVLDEALIRPGRTDKIIGIDYADSEQLMRLLKVLLNVDTIMMPRVERHHRVTPAAVVEAIKPFLGETDPAPAVAAVTQLLLDAKKADPVGSA